MLSITAKRENRSYLGRAFLSVCLSVCLSSDSSQRAGATGPPLRLYLAAPPAAPPPALSGFPFPFPGGLVPKRNQILCNPKNQV